MSAASQIAGTVGDLLKQKEASEQRERAIAVLRAMPELQLPDGDYSFLDYAGDYNPDAYGKPKAAAYETVSEDPRVRDMEMAALQRLIEQGDAVGQAKAEAARYGALDEANQLARGREGAIRQRMAQAGQGGSGMDAILQAQSAQSAANRARAGTLDATHMAALEKLANEQAILGSAGKVRGEDMSLAAKNADIINRFNLFNTQAENEIARANVDNQNQAQLRNVNTRQDISGRNTGIRNSNLDRKTSNARAVYDSRAGKSTAIANAMGGQANQSMQQGGVYNQLGQQGSQLFTNIGAGITAEQARQPQQSTIRVAPPDEQGSTYDQMIIRG